MSMSGLRRKRRNREGTVRLNHVAKLVHELCADLAMCTEKMNQQIDKCKQLNDNVHSDLICSKDEMNQRIEELRADLANSKEEMNQRAFAGPSMTSEEDLRDLIQLNHEQTQRQLQQMQAQIDLSNVMVYSGSLKKDIVTDRISPYGYRWKSYFGMTLWTLVILGLIFGCGWNLKEILQDMMKSPTVTKMTYTLHDNLSLPPISVYQYNLYKSFNTQMLHVEKLFKALENGSLTEAYLEAIIKGVGFELFFQQDITVQPSEITEAYKEAILRYGSLTEAGLAFYGEYGIACDELFTECKYYLSFAVNCCNIFEILWGLNGPQYALKLDTIFLNAFQQFTITLRTLPNMEALRKGDFVEEQGTYQPFWIGISNGVDQNGLDAHAVYVQPTETVIILLRRKKRNVKVSKDCVDVPPKLRYFRDYIMNNCFVERCILDKLSLCNNSCEIPLLQLLNPESHRGPPCEFDVVNSTCWDLIKDSQLECSPNHVCRIPCDYTEIEYSVTKYFSSMNPREIVLYLRYDTTEVQTFEDTERLTLWECLSLISGILDLWLGITIFSLCGMLYRSLSRITFFKRNDFGKDDSTASLSVNADHQHEIAGISNTGRD